MTMRVPPAIELTAHLLQGAQRVATDAVAGSTRAIPRSVAGLDADYLSRLLGRTVTSAPGWH